MVPVDGGERHFVADGEVSAEQRRLKMPVSTFSETTLWKSPIRLDVDPVGMIRPERVNRPILYR